MLCFRSAEQLLHAYMSIKSISGKRWKGVTSPSSASNNVEQAKLMLHVGGQVFNVLEATTSKLMLSLPLRGNYWACGEHDQRPHEQLRKGA